MKHTTYYKILPSGVPVITDHKDLWENMIPLYTAHEIAEFVRGLASSSGRLRPTLSYKWIADKIEEEAK